MSETKEWERIQERTFTKWVNAHLRKRGMVIENLINDLETGVPLINLYEVISDETLGKHYTDPKSKFHKIANLGIVLQKINSFVHSVGIKVEFSAEQVLEKDKRQILGMIWCLIHKFEIQDISEDELSAREGLLLWCKKKTKDYKQIRVDNFNTSWQDGLAFIGLIHKHRPDLIADPDTLDKSNAKENLQLAFDVAEKELDIPQLLDADDLVNYKPDDKSVMTYVAYYWKKFASSNKNEILGKKIGKVAQSQRELENMQHDYERRATDLEQWMDTSSDSLSDPTFEHFGNSLAKALDKNDEFKKFKDGDKPEKAKERTDLELLLSNIRTKQKSEGLPIYKPPQNLDSPALTDKWGKLGLLQDKYDVSLKAHISLMKRLELLYARFVSRATKINGWQTHKIQTLSEEDLNGYDTISALQARLKVHETFFDEAASVEKSLAETKSIGQKIIDGRHEKADEVANTSQELTDKQQGVYDSGNQFKTDLENRLAQLEEILNKSLELAKTNEALNMFLEDSSLALIEPVSANNVEDVEHYIEVINKLDEEIKVQEPNLEKAKELDEWLKSNGANPKRYSAYTIQDIEERFNDAKTQITTRKEDLDEEKVKQQKIAELLEEFHSKAEEYKSFIEAQNVELNTVGAGSLEEQLTELKKKGEDALEKNEAHYTGLKGLIEQLEAADVVEQTTVTLSEITTMYENLKTIVESRASSLEQQILVSKTGNISEEQLKEFETTFKYFDKDKDNKLNKRDFKACCASLGEDIPDSQLDSVFKQYDANKDELIEFEEFVDYMSKNLKIGSSYEDVIDAFSQLAGGADFITEGQLRGVMEKEEADFLLSKMPQVEGGYDYKSYLNNTFARE